MHWAPSLIPGGKRAEYGNKNEGILTQQVRHIYANIENILKFEQCISVYDREKWTIAGQGTKRKKLCSLSIDSAHRRIRLKHFQFSFFWNYMAWTCHKWKKKQTSGFVVKIIARAFSQLSHSPGYHTKHLLRLPALRRWSWSYIKTNEVLAKGIKLTEKRTMERKNSAYLQRVLKYLAQKWPQVFLGLRWKHLKCSHKATAMLT